MHPDTVVGKVSAGAAVGVVNSVVSTPVELVKIRLQTQGNTAAAAAVPYRGSFHCVSSVVNSDGLLGLYRGFPASFLAQSVAYGVRFYAYDAALQHLVPAPSSLQHPPPPTPAWASLAAGAMSGAALWATVYPLDVLKSKIQAGRELDYSCFSRGLRTLVSSTRLPSDLYRGLAPCLVRGAAVNAVMFLAFEQTKALLHGLGNA